MTQQTPSPRMAPLEMSEMDDIQRRAAQALIDGPRKAVKGPFIALLRSPELMEHIQQVGAYLRFHSALPERVSEFTMLLVARHCTQDFEWHVHVPLALKAGTSQATVDAIREGRRPDAMSQEEALAHDATSELLAHHGLCEATYAAVVARWGERGAVELTSLIGYFLLVSLVLNVARTPAEPGPPAPPLPRWPL